MSDETTTPAPASADATDRPPAPPAADADASPATPDPASAGDETRRLPLVPLKGSVVFPFAVLPITVGRRRSLAAAEAALAAEDKQFAVFTQKDLETDTPDADGLHPIGCQVVIRRMARGEDKIELLVQGLERVELVALHDIGQHLEAEVRLRRFADESGPEIQALERELLSGAGQLQSLTQGASPLDLRQIAAQIEEPMQLVFLLAALLNLDLEKALELLATDRRSDAMRLVLAELHREVQVLELRQEISQTVRSEMGKEQREYHLRQQMQAIQDELGESRPGKAEADELRRRLDEADLPEEVKKEAERELERFAALPPAAPDFQLKRAYLELILELPWTKLTEDDLDLDHARRVLDEDHYGLEEVKDRILEHLAVLKLNPEAKAPILCFVGPPGVGKTSLGQSIARALGREFERLSLGGLHDEAELRGHRRTYIGAMPGRIVQGIRRAGVRNPVMMLDEVDKVGRDFRGDPTAALLEILDPAQNKNFRDNYLELPFDLSKVFFITTANSLDPVPRPLRDRMETIRIAGYSDEEKLEIARRYLLPRQRREAGLSEEQLAMPDATIAEIIARYTREAGVRNLERTLGRVARKLALRVARGEDGARTLGGDDLQELLGPPPFSRDRARERLDPGVATGLAWTETGGDVLYVEAVRLPEGEKLTLTGQLGDVMRESAQAAKSWVTSHAQLFATGGASFDTAGGVHIHVPAGAIPKDGPSAGVTMAAALASLYSGETVRADTAMTGEITLSGLVLPVGGIKEKVLAARRAGIARVILPRDNEKDLVDVPEHVRGAMEFLFARRIEEVLAAAVPALAERLQPTTAAAG